MSHFDFDFWPNPSYNGGSEDGYDEVSDHSSPAVIKDKATDLDESDSTSKGMVKYGTGKVENVYTSVSHPLGQSANTGSCIGLSSEPQKIVSI